MTSRYHIHTKPAPPDFPCPANFRLGEGDDYVKYGHAPFEQGRRGGDPYWTSEIITQTWYQAETGRIPISGAGYGGAFAGPGFDAMWLDMSEIVRPTRDGIHGRETISTTVLLGRHLPALQFDAEGRLVSELPPQVELPIPVLFDPLPLPLPGHGAQVAFIRAAARLGTLALVRVEAWMDELAGYAGTVAPVLTPGDDPDGPWVRAARLVEIEAEDEQVLPAALAMAKGLQAANPRAWAARFWDSFISTGEGGYPDELIPYANHIITQVATGLFGVREDTIQRARIVELKYAQGAKPGLGGHLLGSKVTPAVAAMRETVAGTSLFSPFPFHSVYSVEDHKKHVDWIKTVNSRALISVKVSTPTDVDMVAVGSYYAGAHILHLDGAYAGTGAAPEIAKKNIAMPIEYAIPKVHHFLEEEGIRDEMVVMASGLLGAEVRVHGSAQDQVGQILKAGKLVVHGDVGQTFLYGAKGGEAYLLGNAAGRPLINAAGCPRVVINGTCLDYLAESFMAGDPLRGGGFVVLNGVTFDAHGQMTPQPTPYPGGNLFSLASGGALYVRDPHRLVTKDQLNGGAFAPLSAADWALIHPYLQENERLFGIPVEALLTVGGKLRHPEEVYRRVAAIQLAALV